MVRREREVRKEVGRSGEKGNERRGNQGRLKRFEVDKRDEKTEQRG